jgi:hypothetical protein
MQWGGLVFLFGGGGKIDFIFCLCSQMFPICSSMVFPITITTGSSGCRIIEVRFCYIHSALVWSSRNQDFCKNQPVF